jgi:hypothetical protein
VVGLTTAAFGANEIAYGITGTNYIREWSGMSEGLYNGLYLGFNIASAVGQIAGNIYMNYGARCFTAGTLVLCKGSDGEKEYRRIEDVKEGDTVWAYDEATGKYGWKEVVRLFRGETLTTATLRIVPEGVGDGGNEGNVDEIVDEIVCTPNHPFLVLNAGADRKVIRFEGDSGRDRTRGAWIAAGDMRLGDKCLLANGKTAILCEHSIQELDKPVATYNFEVKGSHTYHVGVNGVCVHNSCRGGNNLKPDPNATGDHSTFVRNPATGKVTHYATYKQNPMNPSGFDELLRFDGIGRAHNGIPTPHMHAKSIPRGARPALPWEIPGF